MARRDDLFSFAAKTAVKATSTSLIANGVNCDTCTLCGQGSGVIYYNRSAPKSIVSLCLQCARLHTDLLQEHRVL